MRVFAANYLIAFCDAAPAGAAAATALAAAAASTLAAFSAILAAFAAWRVDGVVFWRSWMSGHPVEKRGAVAAGDRAVPVGKDE